MRHLLAMSLTAVTCGAAALALADALPNDSCPDSYAAGQSCAGVTLEGAGGPDGTGPACAVCVPVSYCHHPCVDGGPIVTNLICEVPDGGDCDAGVSSGGTTGSATEGSTSSGGHGGSGGGTGSGGTTGTSGASGGTGGGGGCGQGGALFGPWLLALAVPFLLRRRRKAA